MTSLKVLSAAAVMALMLPLAAAPTASFAQDKGSGMRAGGGGPAIRGGGGFRGGGAAIGGGGGFRGGGGGIAVSPGARFGGGGAAIGAGPRYSGGGNWQARHGHRPHRRYGGIGTGLIIGGALGSSYGYYGAPYGYGYYDDGYYEEPLVAVAPDGDAIEYCRQRFKSYDVRSGTYLGYDGLRHACP